ncbi:hypothetical protein [Arthrobacter sp. AOP36-C1-22]|uniref:hypothetical protein n=1 Tax=Arthrobacter sp. AOP36-C1-22 TaxID=3457683 RepID=UPI004034B879
MVGIGKDIVINSSSGHDQRKVLLNPYQRIWSLAFGAFTFVAGFTLILAIAKSEEISPHSLFSAIPEILPTPQESLTVIGVSAAIVIGLAVGSAAPPDIDANSAHAKQVVKLGESALNVSGVVGLSAGIAGFAKAVLPSSDPGSELLGILALFAGLAMAFLTESGNAGYLGRASIRHVVSKERIQENDHYWRMAWGHPDDEIVTSGKPLTRKIIFGFLARATIFAILILIYLQLPNFSGNPIFKLVVACGLSVVLSIGSIFLAIFGVQAEIDRRRNTSFLRRYVTGTSRGYGFYIFALMLTGATILIIFIATFLDGSSFDGSNDADNNAQGFPYAILIVFMWMLSWGLDIARWLWLRRVKFSNPCPRFSFLSLLWSPLGESMLNQAAGMRVSEQAQLRSLRDELELLLPNNMTAAGARL